jgi:hypothetical protein
MKKILLLNLLLTLSFPVYSVGNHRVKGYTKKDGTYVQSHRQTNPNKTQRDNWSSKPNTNPYTGKDGTREPKK